MSKTPPDGFHTATSYLHVRGAARAIEFYQRAFGATERYRLSFDGKIGHAEIQIGDSIIMLSDENKEWGNLGPQSIGGSPGSILLYVADVDTMFARAVECGATVLQPVKDQFYGDRSGKIADPFGHSWMIATHLEDVSPEEMQKRFLAMCQ